MSRDGLQRESVFRSVYNQNLYQAKIARSNLIASSKDSLDYVQRLGLLCRLHVHSGCVNTVHWNDSGEYLLSGSDDQFIAVTNPHNQKVLLKYKTAHRANIFSARFMPHSCDHSIVSCAGDGIVLHTQLMAPYIRRANTTQYFGDTSNIIHGGVGIFPPMYAEGLGMFPRTFEGNHGEANLSFFNCHKSGTTYEVLTVPSEPRSFMSCGEDGTVRLFDLRQISSCHKTCCKDNILIFSPSAVNSMDLSPISNHYIAVGSSDAIVRIYDRRYLSVIDFSDSSIPTKERHTRPIKAYPIPLPTKRQYRVTSVKYSPEESELLVSYSSEYLYLFDLKQDGADVNGRYVDTGSSPPPPLTAEQVTRRLRLRGDWSDTGPDARPDASGRGEVGQVRPQLQANIMSRMTEVISRMLNDPRTRIGLTGQVQELNQNQASMLAAVARDSTQDMAPSTSAAWRRAASRLSYARIANRTTDSAASSPSPNNNDVNITNNVVADVEMQDVDHDDDEEIDTTPTSTPTTTISDNTQFQDDATALNDELAELDMEAKDMIFDYLRMKFVGHRNARTMIKEASFWGNNYVMSGSDCGHIFTWDRRNGKLVNLMQGDQHVVNCLQPHPELPYLASSGIDYDVKIWAPILQATSFNEEEAEDLMKRNAVMLEQTKDTITVPAAFMIRMLACIHSLRNRERATATNADNNNSAASVNENDGSDDSRNNETNMNSNDDDEAASDNSNNMNSNTNDGNSN